MPYTRDEREKDRALSLFDQGHKPAQVAKQLDIPERTVQQWARERKLDKPWEPLKSSPEDTQAVLKVLHALIRDTQGRKRWLAQREAELIAYLRRLAPDESVLTPQTIATFAWLCWQNEDNPEKLKPLFQWLAFVAARPASGSDAFWEAEKRGLVDTMPNWWTDYRTGEVKIQGAGK